MKKLLIILLLVFAVGCAKKYTKTPDTGSVPEEQVKEETIDLREGVEEEVIEEVEIPKDEMISEEDLALQEMSAEEAAHLLDAIRERGREIDAQRQQRRQAYQRGNRVDKDW